MKAFRSFVQGEVSFPPNGLVLVRGTNPVTGDSSGTGKSTIMLAVAYALDMCPFPATELQSWYTDEPMQVELLLDTPRGSVVIKRGKKNSFKVGDQPPITGAKAIAEAIRETFGLDADTLRSITYRAQNTRGLFLSLSDSEKKEFLTRILGLAKVEQAVDLADSKIKELESLIRTEENLAFNLQNDLDRILEQELPEFQSDVAQKEELLKAHEELTAIQANIKAAWDGAKEAKEKASEDPRLVGLNQTLLAARGHLENAKKANQDRFKQFQTKQEGLRGQLKSISAQEIQLQTTVSDIYSFEQKLKKALEGKCHTCLRPWDEAEGNAVAIRMTLLNLNANRESYAKAIKGKKEVEEALRETFPQDAVLEKLESVVDTVEDQIRDRTMELSTGPTQEAQRKVNELNILRASVSTRIRGLEQQITMIADMNRKLESTRKSMEKERDETRKRLDQHKAKLADLQKQQNTEKDFSAMMGYQGFLGVIFGDALRDIEIRTNERLARLANVSNVTIHFKSEVVTGKGTIKRIITPIAYIGGHEAKLESGLSGGMYTSVEGVVDLAVMAVAQERTGTLPGFLFLDESFNGQGNATKESAMEVLREYGQEKLVIVVDHSSELKETFSQFIDIISKNGVSEVE